MLSAPLSWEERIGCLPAARMVPRPVSPFLHLSKTAKANGLEPYAYLHHIFEKLPQAQTEQELKDLLPQNNDLDCITIGNLN